MAILLRNMMVTGLLDHRFGKGDNPQNAKIRLAIGTKVKGWKRKKKLKQEIYTRSIIKTIFCCFKKHLKLKFYFYLINMCPVSIFK